MTPGIRLAAGLGVLGLVFIRPAGAQNLAPGEVWIRPVPALPAASDVSANAAANKSAKSAAAAPEVSISPTSVVPMGARPLLGPPDVRESPPFLIGAPERASGQAVLHLAQRLPDLMAKFFPWPPKPPFLVEIELVPAASVEFVGPFLITVDSAGHGVAQVRWGPETKFSDVCQAVAQVSLKSLAVWRGGPAAAAKTPDWLALALGKLLEVGLKPPVIEELSQQGQTMLEQKAVLSLRQIMTTPGPYGDAQPVVAVNAYWLLRFMSDQCRTPAQAEALFAALAIGTDPAKAITTAFPNEFDDPRDLELWWQVGYREYTRAHATPAQTIAQSRAQLDALEYVLLPDGNGGTQRTRLDQAWGGRADKAVRDAIAMELITGRTLPVQANPIYRNAMVSLLTALELLHGDDEKKFTDAWAVYLTDRADAEAIADGVEAALGEAGGTSNIERSTANAQ